MERVPNAKAKQEEQYPLLKVDTGGGDEGVRTPHASLMPVWSVACSPKQSWIARWPELFSACWMTMILLGISFLVFYAVGMGLYRHHQPVIVMKCNNSNPAANVFLHHIVQRGSYVPFVLYSEYLSAMAVQYPNLIFNVHFLIDDSIQSTFHSVRHNRFISKLMPCHSTSIYNNKLDEINRRQINEYQRRYQNVNITIILLSKYMALTPLRYKWRTIPISYLPFYVRVFAVWENGGIGMDLNSFNSKFNNRFHYVDRRISTILKEHNDGIKINDYANKLNKIEREEENELFNIFYGLVYQILNETRSLFNRTLSFAHFNTEPNSQINNKSIELKRNKRTVEDTSSSHQNMDSLISDIQLINGTIKDLNNSEYKILEKTYPITPSALVDSTNKNDKNSSSQVFELAQNINMTKVLPNNEIIPNDTKTPHLVLFYDFTMFTDILGPLYLWPDSIVQQNIQQTSKADFSGTKKRLTEPHVLSIEPDGTFVAASTRLHPFLGHLISAGCQRMHPRFAIQDAFLTQCAGIFKNDIYCNSIYIL